MARSILTQLFCLPTLYEIRNVKWIAYIEAIYGSVPCVVKIVQISISPDGR